MTADIQVKDGFILVAVCWFLPFAVWRAPVLFQPGDPSFIECLFESDLRIYHHRLQYHHRCGGPALRDCFLAQSLPLDRRHGCAGVFAGRCPMQSNGEHTVHVMKAESPGPTSRQAGATAAAELQDTLRHLSGHDCISLSCCFWAGCRCLTVCATRWLPQVPVAFPSPIPPLPRTTVCISRWFSLSLWSYWG